MRAFSRRSTQHHTTGRSGRFRRGKRAASTAAGGWYRPRTDRCQRRACACFHNAARSSAALDPSGSRLDYGISPCSSSNMRRRRAPYVEPGPQAGCPDGAHGKLLLTDRNTAPPPASDNEFERARGNHSSGLSVLEAQRDMPELEHASSTRKTSLYCRHTSRR